MEGTAIRQENFSLAQPHSQQLLWLCAVVSSASCHPSFQWLKPPLSNALRTSARVPAGFLEDPRLGNLSPCVTAHGTRGGLNHSCSAVEHAHVPLCSGTPGSSPDHRGLWAEQPLICLISGNLDFRAGSEPTQMKVLRLNPAALLNPSRAAGGCLGCSCPVGWLRGTAHHGHHVCAFPRKSRAGTGGVQVQLTSLPSGQDATGWQEGSYHISNEESGHFSE